MARRLAPPTIGNTSNDLAWVVVAGLLAGALAALLARRTGRSRGLVTSYAALVATIPWIVMAFVTGNRVEGMGGIPYLVAGGVLFWCFFVPAACSVVLLEKKRSARPRP